MMKPFSSDDDEESAAEANELCSICSSRLQEGEVLAKSGSCTCSSTHQFHLHCTIDMFCNDVYDCTVCQQPFRNELFAWRLTSHEEARMFRNVHFNPEEMLSICNLFIGQHLPRVLIFLPPLRVPWMNPMLQEHGHFAHLQQVAEWIAHLGGRNSVTRVWNLPTVVQPIDDGRNNFSHGIDWNNLPGEYIVLYTSRSLECYKR